MHSTTRQAWRLILSPSQPGPRNMAVDEAILEAVASGGAPPTLRLYAWQPPCLSLGYAQPVTDVDREALGRLGWDLVRRPTGGRAILHTDEITYAVIAPDDDPLVAGGVLASYRRLSLGLLAALRRLGLEPEVKGDEPVPQATRHNPVCFQVPSAYEITVRGKKLVGSAQVRRRGAVLQHGTLPLQGDIARVCQALRFADETQRAQAAALVRARAATVESLLGRAVTWEEAAEALRWGFTRGLGLTLRAVDLSQGEEQRAAHWVQERYAHPEWTERL